MALLSNAFRTINNTQNLPPREYRMNPRPMSMNKLNDLQQDCLSNIGQLKNMDEFKNIQYTNKLGSFRPDNKNCVDKEDLSPNYLPREYTNEEIINVCNNNCNNENNIREPMSKFEDWLILGGIVIAVGLFMRIKDRF